MTVRRLAWESVVYGGGDLAGKLINLMTFPLIATALSPRAYGAVELVMTPVALFGVVVGCGLGNATQRFYWEHDITREAQASLVTSGMLVQLAFGIGVMLLGWLAIPLLLPAVKGSSLPLGWVALASAALLIPTQQWLQYVLDVTRLHFAPFKYLTVSMLSRVLGALLGVFVVVRLHAGVDGLLAVQAAAALAVMPIALWLIRRDLTRQFSRERAWAMMQFGYPFIYQGMAFWLFGSMDRWLLTSMTSVEQVGIYAVAFRFASAVMFVSAAFGQAWSPYAMKVRIDEPEHYRSIYAAVLLLLLFLMLLVGGALALFSGEFISVVMHGHAYDGSAIPLAILCFAVVLQATMQVTATGISLEKRTSLFARLAWATAAVNFVGCVLLIPRFGPSGAAIATAVSYLLLTGSYLFFTQRLHALPLQAGRLTWLLVLAGGLAVVSVRFNTHIVDWKTVAAKTAFGFLCVALAYPALPIKEIQRAAA